MLAALMAVFTFVACWPVRRLLRMFNRMDVPNDRSSHTEPTARGGGLAILVATPAAVVLTLGSLGTQSWSVEVWAGLFGAAAFAGLGLVDDLTDLNPRVRLLAQVVVGAAVGAGLEGWTGALLGSVVITTGVNMVNFMDGINGLSAGHGAVWGVAALAGGSLSGSEVLAVLGAVSLGGSFGFLPFNAPKARLFLGDVGSYYLGGLAGVGVLVALLGVLDGDGGSLKVLALLCAPYHLFATDTATTLARRAARGENLLQAHRDHVYQHLVHDRGWPHWAVSLAVVVVSILVTGSLALGWWLGAATALIASVLYLASPRLRFKEVTL